jgi:hypothetical protein
MSEEAEPSQYTGPKEFVHLHLHSLFSSLDGVPSAEQYADACLKAGFPAMAATEHGHMASFPDMYFAFKKRNLKYISGCFLPDQNILTDSGISKIQAIQAGSKAYTHLGRFCDIKNLQTRHYDGDIIRIKAWGVEDQISTPEHPYLVREVTREEVARGAWEEKITVDWKRACEIERKKYWRTYSTKRSKDKSSKRRYKHYLCVPRLPLNSEISYIDITDKAFLDGVELTVNDGTIERATYPLTSYAVNLPSNLQVTDDLLWIAGLWLAEGSISDSGLIFSLGGDKEEFAERVRDYFEQYGITTSSRRRDGDTEARPRFALDVTVFSRHFARIFECLFGKGFSNKSIPQEWLMRLSPSQAKSLLDGLFDGNAKIGLRQSNLKLCNENLIWQARILMTKLDVPQHSAITPIPNNNSDNIGYSIRRRESGHFYYDYDDTFIYLPVYEVSTEHYSGNVYNLEVEDDNSYYTGVAVHNCEIYYNDYEELRRKFDKAGKKPKSLPKSISTRITRNRHLTVLAKNAVGVSNLIKLTTLAWQDAYGGKPRIWFDKLCERKEGLIVLSGCVNGPLSHELRLDIESDIENGKPCLRSKADRTAVEYLKNFKEAFGEDFFIEVQMPCLPELHDVQVFRSLIEYADAYGVKPVITNDAHYLTRDDAYLQKIMMAVDQKTDIHDTNMFASQGDEQFFKSRAELWTTFKNGGYSEGIDDAKFEEVCDNTLLVADRCEKLAPDTSPKIPDWSSVEVGVNANEALREIVDRELKRRGWDKDTKKWPCDGRMVTYAEQAEIELNRFIDKGFSSYFLITRDWIQWGRERGWPFGPRGSAAGSLVCYLLGIHNINSLAWELSFDRFLASSRGGYMLKTKIDG